LTLIRLSPDGATASIEREVAVECPVAIEVDGFGYAVMMMTPERLEDFATGFLLTERLVDAAGDILAIEPFAAETGWIVRVTLAEHLRGRMQDRVRHRTSDTSCGLCGLSGLEQIARPVTRRPPPPRAGVATLFETLGTVRAHQPLNARTGAAHAAIACDAAGAVLATAEDVGRHNALDKLVGALTRDAALGPDFHQPGDRPCPCPRPDADRAGPARCDAGRARSARPLRLTDQRATSLGISAQCMSSLAQVRSYGSCNIRSRPIRLAR
jgi:FdhD protein